MAAEPITHAKAAPARPDGSALLAALDEERRGACAEPGANPFRQDPGEAAEGQGALLTAPPGGQALAGQVR